MIRPELYNELDRLIRPVCALMQKELHPHHEIIVDNTGFRLVETQYGNPILVPFLGDDKKPE